MTTARLLTIMGSGETAPTMVKVHRQLIERVGGGPSVLLDTPYGFQENADDISEKAQGYFARSVGAPIDVTSWRSAAIDALAEATALQRIEAARYVFAGPGSPSYALDVWRGSPLVALLAAKLEHGGAVTFASAAALTLGLATVPVYEIYKAGRPPRWLDGLDLLGAATGLKAAVIPHFDNAEGGNHDTRFCYLGEPRLVAMMAQLPPEAFVLGVDEHTGLVLDLEEGRASVVGLGTVTVRVGDRATVWPAGTELAIDDLRAAATGGGAVGMAQRPPPDRAAAAATEAAPRRTPLLAEADRLEAVFSAALAARDVPPAVNAILELDALLAEWSADTTQSDEPDRVRVTLRSMIVRLGEVAVGGAQDRAEVVAPYVEAVLEARTAAREAKDWASSDRLRDQLLAAGVEVRDTPDGQRWTLTTS